MPQGNEQGRRRIALGASRSPADRESVLRVFSQAVKAEIRKDLQRSFGHEQLVLMLLELAKNTFDHSGGSGHLDLSLPSGTQPLVARYVDTGEAFDWSACCARGISSKAGNGINFGLGLGIISNGATAAGLQLSVSRIEGSTVFQITT